MKKEHIVLMQLEQGLNNLSAVISQEEDKAADPERFFGYFDEVMLKLLDYRILATHRYEILQDREKWEEARALLTK